MINYSNNSHVGPPVACHVLGHPHEEWVDFRSPHLEALRIYVSQNLRG